MNIIYKLSTGQVIEEISTNQQILTSGYVILSGLEYLIIKSIHNLDNYTLIIIVVKT